MGSVGDEGVVGPIPRQDAREDEEGGEIGSSPRRDNRDELQASIDTAPAPEGHRRDVAGRTQRRYRVRGRRSSVEEYIAQDRSGDEARIERTERGGQIDPHGGIAGDPRSARGDQDRERGVAIGDLHPGSRAGIGHFGPRDRPGRISRAGGRARGFFRVGQGGPLGHGTIGIGRRETPPPRRFPQRGREGPGGAVHVRAQGVQRPHAGRTVESSRRRMHRGAQRRVGTMGGEGRGDRGRIARSELLRRRRIHSRGHRAGRDADIGGTGSERRGLGPVRDQRRGHRAPVGCCRCRGDGDGGVVDDDDARGRAHPGTEEDGIQRAETDTEIGETHRGCRGQDRKIRRRHDGGGERRGEVDGYIAIEGEGGGEGHDIHGGVGGAGGAPGGSRRAIVYGLVSKATTEKGSEFGCM
mmetsp:Transcript_25208/g.74053  ORF Transcript_25208/g.74053 Transcript_25208/m.74053 type:complete len:411 (-) Transcript_25208:44-1276(-)